MSKNFKFRIKKNYLIKIFFFVYYIVDHFYLFVEYIWRVGGNNRAVQQFASFTVKNKNETLYILISMSFGMHVAAVRSQRFCRRI